MSKKLIVSYQVLGVCAFSVLLAMSWLMPSMTGTSDAGSGNLVRQMVYLGLFGLALTASRSWKHPLRTLQIQPFIVIAIGFCWLSILWSLDPSNSVRRLLLTTMVLISIFLLIETIGYIASVRALISVLIVFMLVSYLAVIFLPSLGIHQENTFDSPDLVGAWKGIYGHKNYAGAALSVLILTMVFSPCGLKRWIRFAVLAAAVFFLYKTASKTSLALVSACAFIGFLFMFYNPRHRLVAVPVFIVTCLSLTATVWWQWDWITRPFSSEDALTGRVQIWPVLVAFWRDHIYGAGYGAFWNISGMQPVTSYAPAKSYVQIISSGHNGYLDLLVTIGPVGLLLVILALGIVPIISMMNATTLSKDRRAFIVSVILFTLAHNMTETSLMDRDQPVHVSLLVAIALMVSSIRQPVSSPAKSVPKRLARPKLPFIGSVSSPTEF